MSAKKGQKKKGASKTAPNKKSSTAQSKPKATERKMSHRILPYVLTIFALILAVCFFMVDLLGIEDGAGTVGAFIRNFFCAILGGGAFAIPLICGYIGIRWCIFNVKWNGVARTPASENYADYVKTKRRLTLSAVTCVLTLLMISTFIGVLADQRDFTVSDFWYDGVELLGGGVFGGSIACLFLLCFNVIISVIIISLLTLLFVMLALGFTPDYMLTRLSESRIAHAERRSEENKALAAQRELRSTETAPKRHEPVVQAAAATATAATVQPTAVKEKRAAKEATVDELLSDNEPTLKPMDTRAAEILGTSEIPIKPADKAGAQAATAQSAATDAATKQIPLDFGGDLAPEDTFNKNEFSTVDDIFKELGTPIAPAKAPETTPERVEKKEVAPQPINLTEIGAGELLEDVAAVAPDEADTENVEAEEVVTPYVFPPIELLKENKDKIETDYTEELQNNAKILVETLKSFKVGIKEVTYSRGPTITRYELKPEVGTRVRSIANLVDDIALNLATSGVRIEAPIPNKAAVGIEVPNQTRATVYLRDLIDSPKFTEAKSRLTASLGMDVGGNPIYFDIGKMPHLLIAGTTGSGKSICINCIIISILYKSKPEDVKLILIDPKKVEFNMYKNIPHLYCPIVSEPKKAAGALASAVAEMERRFELIESVGVRDLAGYNAAIEGDPEKEYLPQMVIIIDELADLMMTARDEVETSICRIAQKARAAGIHLILGTQRPSVDVITGLIKANVPSRIACTVISQVDSRTIIDVAGAENLIGRGDMLFSPVGSTKPMRVQGAFVSDGEVESIVNYISENNGKAKYNTDFINRIEEEAAKCGMGKKGASASMGDDESAGDVEGGDSKFRDAVKLAIESGKISTSLMQRRLGVGYGRAAKIIDTMEQMGYVSAPDGNKPRQVLITMDEYMRRITEGTFEDADV